MFDHHFKPVVIPSYFVISTVLASANPCPTSPWCCHNLAITVPSVLAFDTLFPDLPVDPDAPEVDFKPEADGQTASVAVPVGLSPAESRAKTVPDSMLPELIQVNSCSTKAL